MCRSVPRGTLFPLLTIAVAAAAVLVWGEAVHIAAARRARRLPLPDDGGGPVVVVVLGFGNRGCTANMVNRWRARIAVRTAQRLSRLVNSVTIVASGGAVRGKVPEAALLRDYMLRSLHWGGPILVEEASESTWENVRNVLSAIEDAAWIAFASNGLHAEKARVYLARQRPDLAERLVAADDYRIAEMTIIKPVFAVVGLRKLKALGTQRGRA